MGRAPKYTFLIFLNPISSKLRVGIINSQMENVKHNFRNNAIVISEKSKDCFSFLKQMPCFYFEHMLLFPLRCTKSLCSSYIPIQKAKVFYK